MVKVMMFLIMKAKWYEPGVIEMNDGQILMYARSNENKQLTYSSDTGKSWSNVVPSNISSPVSPAIIEKDPETGTWIMIWNNNDGTDPEIENVRTPLTIATSDDEGITWQRVTNIETLTTGWFCYAIHFEEMIF